MSYVEGVNGTAAKLLVVAYPVIKMMKKDRKIELHLQSMTPCRFDRILFSSFLHRRMLVEMIQKWSHFEKEWKEKLGRVATAEEQQWGCMWEEPWERGEGRVRLVPWGGVEVERSDNGFDNGCTWREVTVEEGLRPGMRGIRAPRRENHGRPYNPFVYILWGVEGKMRGESECVRKEERCRGEAQW